MNQEVSAKVSTEKELEKNSTNAPRNEYYFRLLIAAAAASTLVSYIDWKHYDLKTFFFIFWVIYPHLAFVISKGLKNKFQIVSRSFSGIDALLLGALANIVNFSLLPTILFFTIIQCQALNTGGIKRWGEDIAIFVFGMGITFIIHRAEFLPMSDIANSLPILLAASLYFILYSFFIFVRMGDIRAQAHSIKDEQKALKLKTWKISRYVSPQVWKVIFSGHDEKLETKRKFLTIFFSDIKGFTDLSEQLEPEDLTALLNEYLTEMSKIVHRFGGTLDKFIGDAVMVFFGDPSTRGQKQDCLACVSMAIEMKRLMKDLQQKWLSEGVSTPLEIRMGINSGHCTAGSFGTEERLDYTILGTEVNLASRLESNAPPSEILISHATYALIKDTITCRDRGKITVKGFSESVQVYQVVDFRKNIGGNQSFFEQRADGFSLYVDLDKVKNFDQEKIIKSLLTVATKLKNKKN